MTLNSKVLKTNFTCIETPSSGSSDNSPEGDWGFVDVGICVIIIYKIFVLKYSSQYEKIIITNQKKSKICNNCIK